MKLEDLKRVLERAYSALLRSESHYLFAVRQRREIELARESEADPLLITPFGWSGYSQNDEDGILQEIFRRIGPGSRKFLEFGAGGCLENTGTYLLLSGWQGKWLEPAEGEIQDIRNHFGAYIQAGSLNVVKTFVTPENINALMGQEEYDLLVIDIDGNDYYIWEAMQSKPRVVMVEYNATFRPPTAVVQEYSPEPFWHGENFYGASLSAFEQLSRKKGYALVGCNYVGTNAFFVRNDLLENHFSQPYTAEHHYREQLIDGMQWGSTRQRRNVGEGKRRYLVLDSSLPGGPPKT